MPAVATRDIFVILLDLKAASRSKAIHALAEIILYKQLAQSKDQYKLYLVNSFKTSNPLNHAGITTWDATASIATLFEEILTVETGQSDWLESLEVAVAELKEWYQTQGVITLQLLFITDLSSFERPNNGKLMNKIIEDISNLDIFLYVVGAPVKPQKTIFNETDIQEWMKSLEVDQDNSNLKIMKKIVNKTPHSVMCDYDLGLHLFHSFKYCKAMQPWQVPLTFGSVLSMPASTIRLSKREAPFKLKSTARRYPVKWAYEDEQDKIIDAEDTVSGIIKHGKFVKIETDGKFKIEGPRSFRALGFTSAENVPEYLLQSDGTYLVIPDQKQPESYFQFFNALVEELERSKMYILVRRVYNKDFNPKFGVLIPKLDFNIVGFLYCPLPYADDIVHPYEEEPIESAPEVDDINDDIQNYLSSIDVTSKECKINVPLPPTMSVYSNAKNIIKKVEEKILEEQYLEKKDIKLDGTAFDFENLKSHWPVRQKEEIKKEEAATNDFDDVDDFDFC